MWAGWGEAGWGCEVALLVLPVQPLPRQHPRPLPAESAVRTLPTPYVNYWNLTLATAQTVSAASTRTKARVRQCLGHVRM